MSPFHHPRCVLWATALAALVGATPTLAAVSAEDVWLNWQEMAERYGQTVAAAEEERAGDTLTLTDVRTRMEGDGGTFEGRMDVVRLVETGDGTVRFELPAQYPLQFVSPPNEDGAQTELDLVVRHEGLAMTASGEPDAVAYAYSADAITIETTAVRGAGEDGDLDVSGRIEGLGGSYDFGAGDPTPIVARLAARALTMTVTGTDPEAADSPFEIEIGATGLEATSEGTLPLAPGADFAALVKAGGTSTGQARYDGTSWTLKGAQEDGRFEAEGGSGSGRLDFALGPQGLSYAGENTDWRMEFRALDLPLPPISVTAAKASGAMRMPLVASGEEQGFGLSLALNELALSEAAWTMFDPAGVLPRDPATLALALSGTGTLYTDVVSATEMEALGDEPPGELRSLSLDQLHLSLAGATLTGSGSATFDNTTTPPAPDGRIDLTLVGANGLIDRLVQMGLIPQDQAMGARMMLGMFARPGEGDDTLVSTIEVRPDGSVLANGMQLR